MGADRECPNVSLWELLSQIRQLAYLTGDGGSELRGVIVPGGTGERLGYIRVVCEGYTCV